MSKKMKSKDERYEMMVSTNNRVGILKSRNYIWITDTQDSKFYEYKAAFWGAFKKAIKAKIM